MTDIAGLDVGTMFMLSAKSVKGKPNDVELKTLRNMYLGVSPDMIESSEMASTDLDYVESKNENGEVESIYIIGEDSFRFANIFGKAAKRPMRKGVITTEEVDAIDVLTLMVEKLVGHSDGTGRCVYSIPAQSVDIDIPPVLYHERVFGKILKSLGFESKPLNEAMAIIFSECQNTNFTGIAISFGAGLTNVACAYKGTPTLTFSISRGGDWIDESVSESLGVVQSRVTSVKEKTLDVTGPTSSNKKERRVQEALCYYYAEIINYVLKVFVNEFEESSEGLEIDEELPIIVSGGTSKPKGFVDLFKQLFSQTLGFPYSVSEIRQAKDPLTAVALGNLVYAMWEQKKNQKSEPGKSTSKKEMVKDEVPKV